MVMASSFCHLFSPLGATAGLKYVTVFVAGFEILRRCRKILVNFSIATFSLLFS